MIYNDFRDLKLSRLGFGAMRLPLLADGSIDEPQVCEMVRIAMENGVNYYDTAYPYHAGMSEVVMGKVLSEYPRESYYLATKYPGHQIAETYNPAEIFEEQLQKCGVDYFDFYLLHNVYEKSIDIYLDPKWGIVDYFLEQKRLGRIRHLGFSCHARPENLKRFLDACGEHMEFCQIQLNYMDRTLQSAEEKYNILTERGIPVWVMEPLRGGKLAKLPEVCMEKLSAAGITDSPARLAFRYLQGLENVKMTLSGMSDIAQMKDNIATYSEFRPLSEAERKTMDEIAELLKQGVPCTGCHYCDGCPMEIDIPLVLKLYNDHLFSPSMGVGMQIDSLEDGHRPQDCIACGACMQKCPQNIAIPDQLAAFADALSKMPSWAELCRQRAEAAAKMKKA